MNRHGKPSTNPAAEFVPSLRELAVFEGYAVPSDGREADDLLRTWANEARRAGKDYIICSIDKDLRCIPGKHYWMHFQPEKQMMLEISEEQAKRFYYEQLLKGDPTDNIPGVPRIGEVKASKIITACDTEAEMQEAVVEQYVIAYGDVWYDYFISNAKLIHLQNHYHDFFDCRHWPIIKELC
jgi:DNA polymerase-1